MDKIKIQAVFLDALRVGRAHLFSFAVLGLVAYSPFIYRAFTVDLGPNAPEPTLDFQALELLLSQLLTGVIAYSAICFLKGKPAGFRKTVNIGIIRMFPIVAVGLISSLALRLLSFASILFLPAMVFAVVITLVLTVVLYVAIPVAVAEQPSIIDSLRRSAELSYGHRWQIFSILILQVMVILVGVQILSLAFGEQGESP
ncbi:MAG: hypothetical protein JKY56_22465, partial [Kofleriaceae bacterium]|nr:hypothetical protein [Kofleriaceae bacterium]